jgi:hypothetical protein
MVSVHGYLLPLLWACGKASWQGYVAEEAAPLMAPGKEGKTRRD